MDKIQTEQECLFCKIIKGEEPSEKVYANDNFIVIKNKFPKAPTHLLIIPKEHVVKQDLQQGKNTQMWQGFYECANEVVQKINLWPNYQLVVNAPGVAHFHHEHMHLISGKDLLE
jgi:histidine triad (HIT) family protein